VDGTRPGVLARPSGARSFERAMRRFRIASAQLSPYVALSPVLVLLVVFLYLPLFADAIYSLHDWSSLSPTWHYVGLGNFIGLWNDPLFWQSLRGNFLYAVVSLIFQVAIALVLAAILESGVVSRGVSDFFRVAFFIPSILPITVIGLLWQILYQPSGGLIDQVLAAVGLGDYAHAWLGEEATALPAIIAVSQWQWTGYLTVLFIVAIRAIPRELYEAAAIDGARTWRTFWHVTVPGVQETTVLMALITIFGAIKVFDIVWVMTAGGPNNASHVLGSYMYRLAFRDDRVGYASAIAVAMFLLSSVAGGLQLYRYRRSAA
jgi:raffinose/stachyose/melibiose transport system permease protein